jgi:hypothetical protein
MVTGVHFGRGDGAEVLVVAWSNFLLKNGVNT